MSVLENKIQGFIDSLQYLVSNHHYHGALTVAFTLPDICSKLEKPYEKNTGTRYSEWFEKYMSHKYKSRIGADRELHVFLNGNDFYALRCAFLHQGETNIEEQRARKVLKDFIFVKPQMFGMIHKNQFNDTLQLQVDIFCSDILFGVEKWLEDNKYNSEINARANNLLEIQPVLSF